MKRYYYFILFLFLLTIFNTKVNAQHVDAGADFSVCQGETEVTLHPNLRIAYTQRYTPESIPFQWDGDLTGTEATTLRHGAPLPLKDDDYSSPVDFPIDFYFLGNKHDKIIIGSNGDVVFNRLAANKMDNYMNFNAGITIPNHVLPYWDDTANISADAIFGAAQDINPSVRYNNGNDTITTIQYKTVGYAPNRKFIVTYNDIPLFGCDTTNNLLLVSQQIIFYETTDIIEVFIKKKPICMSWTHHAAAIGVQNYMLAPNTCGTAASPTRNTGDWTVDASSPEGWRFLPAGNTLQIKWYDQNRNIVGTTANATVPFSDTETFTIEVTFEDCNGNSFTEYDEVTVSKLPEIKVDAPLNNVLCANETLHYDATVKNPNDFTNITYTWTEASGATIGTGATLDINAVGAYILTINADNCVIEYPFEIEAYPYACKVPEGISPNDDGDNDYFELTYLSKKGEGIDKLEIFDRRGVLVYEKDGYANEFIGKTNDDKELPAATYFYVIKMMDGEKITGWLYIVR